MFVDIMRGFQRCYPFGLRSNLISVSEGAYPFGLRSNAILLVHRLDGGNALDPGEPLH